MQIFNKTRFVIKIIITLLIYTFLFVTTMPYDENDVYEVSGICIDVKMDTMPVIKGADHTKRIIVMNDGKEYHISRKDLKKIGLNKDTITEFRSLVGKELSFFAEDPKINPFVDHRFFSWNNGDTVGEILDTQNKAVFINGRLIAPLICTFLIGFLFIPEILYLWCKHDEKVKRKISERNKIIRKAKKEVLKAKIVSEGYNPKQKKKKHK